ncbi:hypothetical protein AOQ84DRAFT_364343 [Glonium stellatum]|uniref:Uncharacterized protein n=1 Tax=Glonium stellatum TaxID=574774 RepID=A0A8E2F0A1_9PEZI|nr:hypothetical protein AOQ84DRAFT_364343 [Glonium stellatum]
MATTNGAVPWECYLRDCVLHYHGSGVLYHHAIVDLIQRDLIIQDVPVWGTWGVLVGEEYEDNEEDFVAEVLEASGHWDADHSELLDGDEATPRYDRYSDEETVCHDLWDAGERNVNTIATKISSKYPDTAWFGTVVPAVKALQFLRQSGRIVSYSISVIARIYPLGLDEYSTPILSTAFVD